MKQQLIMLVWCFCVFLMITSCTHEQQPPSVLHSTLVPNTLLMPTSETVGIMATTQVIPTAIPVRTGVVGPMSFPKTPSPEPTEKITKTMTPTPTPTNEERTPTSTPMDEERTPTPTATERQGTATPTPSAAESTTPTQRPTPDDVTPTLDARPVIPRVIGLSSEEAINRLRILDPAIQVEIEPYTGQCATNDIVVDTLPSAGTTIDPESLIVLTVCKVTSSPTSEQHQGTTMPDLIGLTEQQARQILTRIGFQGEFIHKADACATDGMVIDTFPPTGTHISSETRIIVTLCIQLTPTPIPVIDTPTPIEQMMTPEQVATPIPMPEITLEMPDLVGKHPDDARKILQDDMGLDSTRISFALQSNDCKKQVVVSTEPAAGESVGQHTTIMIGVCAPPKE